MNTFSHVPPGFRFHPTEEELVDYYLRKKVASEKIDLDVIKDVDLYRIEPWDIQELCKIGSDEQSDWYLFSHKDKKYPTGTRTNRATKAGFWKATGRDKAIYSKHCLLVGMRKTLVFYKGRAPNGHKSDWIMHEYRLETNENGTPPEEGWVVCRVFKKRMTAVRKMGEYYDHQVFSFMPELQAPENAAPPYHHQQSKPELQYYMDMDMDMDMDTNTPHHDASPFLTLPQLEESPKLIPNHEVTDWRVLDKYVASQLSHDQDVLSNDDDDASVFDVAQQIAMLANGPRTNDRASASTSTSHWKSTSDY